MSSTSLRSRRSCSERSRSNSPGSSVIGVSSRNRAHCSRVKIREGLYCWSAVRISMTSPLAVKPKPVLFARSGRTNPSHSCRRNSVFACQDRTLVRLARGLLFQSRHLGALCQHGLDILKLHAARLQQNEQVKQQVGTFADQMVTIVLYRGDDGLHRLFA